MLFLPHWLCVLLPPAHPVWHAPCRVPSSAPCHPRPPTLCAAYSTAGPPSMPLNAAHRVHMFQAYRVGHVTAMCRTPQGELWTGSSRGNIRWGRQHRATLRHRVGLLWRLGATGRTSRSVQAGGPATTRHSQGALTM